MKDVPVESSGVEEIESLVVCEERIGAVLKEEVYDVVMAFLRSPENWCRNSISSLCVYVCARLY